MVASSRIPVVCPDCGQSFTARGLSGHRRQRHGLAPAPALPGATSERAKDQLPAILDALSTLREGMARLERQIAARDSAGQKPETPAEEIGRLEHDLEEVLVCISGLRSSGLASTNLRVSASEPEQRASRELARLRREQARIVYRIAELRLGSASDDRFLI